MKGTKQVNEEINDALVDTYRALRAMNRAATEQPPAPIVKGAGVNPNKVIVVGKRLRNWHRHSRRIINGRGLPLRAYSRLLAECDGDYGRVANAWLRGKGITRASAP